MILLQRPDALAEPFDGELHRAATVTMVGSVQ